MYDVFLSYARSDRKRAEQFQRAIARSGWTVWWDADLLPGQKWNDVIEKELRAAGAVVVLWSETSVKSEFVCDEARIGRELNKLVPVTIDGNMGPVGMGQRQVEDMTKWDGKNPEYPGIVRVLSGIRQILRPGPHQTPAPILPHPEPGTHRPNYVLVAAILVVILAAGIFAASYFGGKAPEPSNTGNVPPITPVEATPIDTGKNKIDCTIAPPKVPTKEYLAACGNSAYSGGGKTGRPAPDGPGTRSTRPERGVPPEKPAGNASTSASAAAATIVPAPVERGCESLAAATRKTPDVATLFFDLGNCYYKEARYNESVGAFNAAIEQSENPKFYEARGLAKWKNNQPDAGITDLSSAITMSPRDAGLYESRGQIYIAKRDYQRAMDDYDKATRLNPSSKRAWLGLADAAEKNMAADVAASARTRAEALP